MFLQWLWGLLSSQAGVIPSSVTDDYDAVLTTSLREYSPRLADNITRGNKWLSWLKSKGRFRTVDGGFNIGVPLMYAQNSTADIYSGYGVLDTTPQDGFTTAFYDWTQLSVSIAISRKEKRQNAGKHKLIDLLRAKTKQAQVSLQELLNNCLVQGRLTSPGTSDAQFTARVGSLDSGAVGPLPLAALIDVNVSRSVSIGNINGNTHSWWRNQNIDSSASSFVQLKNEMNQLYNLCSKGIAGSPDLWFTDRIGWETYWLSLTQNERYIIDDKRTVDILGGSDALKFRSAAIIWDEVMPDPSGGENILDGTEASINESVFYALNSEALEWIVDSGSNFITTPFMRPENQDATVAQILWMGAMGVNHRRKLGVLDGVSQTITS